MNRKALIICLLILSTLLLVGGYISYWLFYPRFTYKWYKYEWDDHKIGDLTFSVRFRPNYQEEKGGKVVMYRSPYDIWVSHQIAENRYITVTNVRVLSNKKIVYESDDILFVNSEGEKWKSVLYGRDIDLEYLDYTVAVEYINTADGKEEAGSFEVLLERKYTEKKYSMFDIMGSV